MIPRGSGRRVALVIVISGLVVIAATLLAYRTPGAVPGPANPATSTLNLDLPGPFNGCGALNPKADATTLAVLDLIRPSAFLTTPTNTLSGEGGAIVSAELRSLHPETVVYSVSPTMRWSDGRRFGVGDLVAWWRAARRLSSVAGDGYRALSSMVVGKDGHTIIATFSSDFADWNLLFRDVEEAGASQSCLLPRLVSQPSLGPYRVQSATPRRIVLVSSPEWTINFNRFRRVVITSKSQLPTRGAAYFVRYAPVASQALVADLVAHPRYRGQLSDSNAIVEVTFSPRGALTAHRSVRAALSWLTDRRNIVSQLFGSLTFTPGVATSALFSQGQFGYPLATKGVAPTPHDFTLVDPSRDCRSCALQILRDDGYERSPQGWRDRAGDTLHVNLAQGPSAIDSGTTNIIVRQWESLGVSVSVIRMSSDAQAALAASRGEVDAAVFERPTDATPWLSARSWDSTPYVDSFPSGVRSSRLHQLFLQAQGIFNPATADLTWLKFDRVILTSFWVRPFYTVPALTEWTIPVTNVVASLSLVGLVDQVSNWGIAAPTTGTTSSQSSTSVG